MEISGKTSVFGILGNPVEHSLSPLLHNYVIRQAGLDAVYIPLGGEWPDAPGLAQGLRGMGINGVSVTIPHKELAYQAAEIRSPAAQLAGSANTLFITPDRKLNADNTDGAGFVDALQAAGASVDSQTAFIIWGNGGTAAGVVAAVLPRHPKVIWVAGRNRDKVAAFARGLRDRRISPSTITATAWFISTADGGDCFPLDTPDGADAPFARSNDDGIRFRLPEALASAREIVLINTTPIGMKADPRHAPHPVPNRLFATLAACAPRLFAFDAVYVPRMTDFMRRGSAVGAELCFGYDMLLHQALRQMRIFYPTATPDASQLRALLLSHLPG